MFELHQVFAPMQPTDRLSGPVRLIDIVAFKKVVVISLDELSDEGPFRLPYSEWVDLVNSGCWRRFKIEPPCRLNFEPGLLANL